MKAKILFLILFMQLCAKAFALDLTETNHQMRQAQALYESHMYPQAIQIYQRILQRESLNEWQRAVIIYDIGSVFLAQGQFDQAIETLQAVSLNNSLAPLINYRAHFNIALAKLKKASSLMTHDAKNSIVLINELLKEIPKLQDYHCLLEEVEGSSSCKPNLEVQFLHEVARMQLAQALFEEEKQLENSPLSEGLNLLLSGVDEKEKEGKFFKQNTFREKQKQKYKNLYMISDKAWSSLWTALQQKLETSKGLKDLKKRLVLYKTALDQFQKGVNALNEEKWEESNKAFEESAKALKELIALPLPPEEKPKEEEALPNQSQTNVKEQQKTKETEQLLSSVLEMQQQDAKPVQQGIIKQVERPW